MGKHFSNVEVLQKSKTVYPKWNSAGFQLSQNYFDLLQSSFSRTFNNMQLLKTICF